MTGGSWEKLKAQPVPEIRWQVAFGAPGAMTAAPERDVRLVIKRKRGEWDVMLEIAERDYASRRFLKSCKEAQRTAQVIYTNWIHAGRPRG